MPDLSSESTRIALMEQAGCDARCGLTLSVSRSSGGEPVLSHHRRDVAEGTSEHTEVARISWPGCRASMRSVTMSEQPARKGCNGRTCYIIICFCGNALTECEHDGPKDLIYSGLYSCGAHTD